MGWEYNNEDSAVFTISGLTKPRPGGDSDMATTKVHPGYKAFAGQHGGATALHRFAVLLAICTLFLVVAGASVTSNQAGLSVPDWPLSYGQVMPEMRDGVFYEHGHRMIASFVGFLTIILAVWIWKVEDRRWLKWLGLAALAGVILQGLLGGMTVLFLLPPAISIAHACLAQIFFSTTIALALFTSPGWRGEPLAVDDAGWPSMRSLAMLMPLLVLAQIALGAGYRHRVFGIMPHVLGAIVVGTMLLAFAVFVLVQYQEHSSLRGTAWSLAGITFVQLLLGVMAFMARVSSLDALQPSATTVVSTVAHVGGGALTVGATVALSLQIFRHVRAARQTMHSGGVPVAS